ncbi:N-acetylgalactosamine 6-sulfate sulfatase [Labilibaculum filiforme]|uniref:N-acetylgalactosamine 6-sulfate sulfatase n=1 Tax=Labilibaculum filiforme TaxID=1940526 RepID=A0A2N3I1T4_9BACT|nr:arylsulfatase [Labilibaculum filiforme]PKQ64278.1 N-acetylgalactosamine 6-sulfate sulfatase [Labilibaculum filiforme]
MKMKTLLGALLMTIACFGCQSKEKIEKPNVILLVTDDQGYGDLACTGNPIIKTPNIDQLHSESVRLTNFHSGTTCTPTRAGLMTGRNSNRNGTWHTIGGCSLLNEKETSIADVFSEGGYTTAMLGKWHLGDMYPFRPQDRGFQTAFYNGGGGVGQTPDYWDNDYFDDTYFRNGKPEKVKGYCTDVWFDEATKFVDENQDKPFFLYLSLNAPHGPYNVPEEYYEMYENADLQPRQKRFYGMITNLDEQVGKLRKHLEEKGLAKNTIFIFMTDNGTAAGYSYDKNEGRTYGYNAGMRGTKGSHYDGGHRVPLFISWPEGIKRKGVDVNSLTAHVDLLPTLADLCGIKNTSNATLDGTSLKNLIEGDSTNVDFDTRMLVTDTQRIQWPKKGRNSCVMTTRWRLIDGDELYDINEDPGQNVNVAQAYPEVVTEMNSFYDQWWKSTEADFEYSLMKIGDEHENPTHLTCHDMHSEQNIPWNQNYIREGLSFTQGEFFTEVVRAGTYKFSISRYPVESNLEMDAAIEGVKATSYTEIIEAGKSLSLTNPMIVVDGKEYPCAFTKDNKAAEVEIELVAGKMNFYGSFTNDKGEKEMAYYFLVERL